jgi:ABC-type sugar transport system permease subunit
MQTQDVRVRPSSGVARKVIGWVLLAPAAVLTVLTLVIPTVRTIVTSLHDETFLRESRYVGFDNYGDVFARLWPSVGFALSLVAAPIVAAVVAAPLVAAAVNWAGGWARVTARVVLSLALVVFAPVALAIAWRNSIAEDDPTVLADADLTGATLRYVTLLTVVGVVCAVGVMLFLPAFRARDRRLWPTLFAIAGVAVPGLLAVGLQQFTLPFVMTGFGPRNETLTPVGLLYTYTYREARAGMGAAVGVVLLAVLAVLGVAAVLVVVLSRLRVTLLPRRQPPVRRDAGAIVLAALVLVAVVAVLVLAMLPWFDALSGQDVKSPSGMQARTWSMAASGALVSVGVAYLAALGISGLRPLGRRSEWLLLPFAPWLFVGVAPLSVEFFKSVRDAGDLDTAGALFPPIMVSLVALVAMAVLCRGQSVRWRQEVAGGASAPDTFFTVVVLPTMPLAALLFVVATFLNAQDLVWPLLVELSPEKFTTPLNLYAADTTGFGQDFSVASATPPLAVILGFLSLTAIQVFHLDRTAATTGAEPDLP